jgi:prephenate dehydrogenase
MQTVSILGVGLIGGSFGLALRRAGYQGRILGVSRPTTIETALRCGAIDAGGTFEDAVAQADLVFLAQPISVIIDVMPRVAACLKPGARVTDAGSTKRDIVAAAQLHFPPGVFLGGHPMAGKAESGVAAAEANLFQGRPWILTPLFEGERNAELEGWITAIGARLLTLDAATHDRVVGAASHLPQFLSTVLAAHLDAHPHVDQVLAAAGPGLHSMTRLALSDYRLWRDIYATNADEIANTLRSCAAALESLDPSTIESAFAHANHFAARLRGK